MPEKIKNKGVDKMKRLTSISTKKNVSPEGIPTVAFCSECKGRRKVANWEKITEGEHKGKFLATLSCGHTTRFIYIGRDLNAL